MKTENKRGKPKKREGKLSFKKITAHTKGREREINKNFKVGKRNQT